MQISAHLSALYTSFTFICVAFLHLVFLLKILNKDYFIKILASFDPDLVDGQTRFCLREVVDQLALGLADHAHGERKKVQKFSNDNQKKNH